MRLTHHTAAQLDQRDGRRELIATCHPAVGRYEIALLDIDVHADPDTARVIAAYRRWTAITAA